LERLAVGPCHSISVLLVNRRVKISGFFGQDALREG
jgi:hypothetical protein